MSNPSDHPLLKTTTPWSQNESDIWLASTLSLHRNLDKFLFPAKLNDEQCGQILSLLSQPILSSCGLKNPTLERADQVPPLEKEYISEHFLLPYTFQQARKDSGFLYDEEGRFLAIFNVQNHLQLQMTVIDEKIEEAYKALNSIEETIHQSCHFSYQNRFGYLTANPKMCGTALNVQIFLQTPALLQLKKLTPFIEQASKGQVKLTNLVGQPSDWIGDLVVVSNRYTLGLTESNIISATKEMAKEIIAAEKNARDELKKSKPSNLLDQISRAFGLLTHSYQLDAKEAMECISLVKLGRSLDLVKDVDLKTLNSLFFLTRRAHLMSHFDVDLASEELLHKRAEFLHVELKAMQLKI